MNTHLSSHAYAQLCEVLVESLSLRMSIRINETDATTPSSMSMRTVMAQPAWPRLFIGFVVRLCIPGNFTYWRGVSPINVRDNLKRLETGT